MTSYFKPIIDAYLSTRPLFFSFIRPQESYLFHRFSKLIRPPILDFGCGDGFFASVTFPKQSLSVGLDIEVSRIRQAEDIQMYQSLVTYDGLKIPLKAQSFQTIVSNCVFEHLPQLEANLKEIYRLLRPGGYLLTSVMTDNWEKDLLGRFLLGSYYQKFLRRRQVHLNLFSKSKWDAVFTSSGFSISHTVGYLHPRAAHWAEISHYLAAPSLFSYKLLGRWVALPSWYKPFNLGNIISRQLATDVNPNTKSAAALFYVLRKPA